MSQIEKFEGSLLLEFEEALATDERNTIRIMLIRNTERAFDQLVRTRKLSRASATRIVEAIESAGETSLDLIDYVTAYSADDLASGGVLIGDHRYVVRLLETAEPVRAPRIRRTRKQPGLPAAPTAPRIIRASEKQDDPTEPGAMPELQPEAVARFLNPDARPKPRGRFSSAGQIEGMKLPSERTQAVRASHQAFDAIGSPRSEAPAASTTPAAPALPRAPRAFDPAPRRFSGDRSGRPFGGRGGFRNSGRGR